MGQEQKVYLIALVKDNTIRESFLRDQFRAAMDLAFELHKKWRDPLDISSWLVIEEIALNSASGGKRIGRWKLNQPHPDEF